MNLKCTNVGIIIFYISWKRDNFEEPGQCTFSKFEILKYLSEKGKPQSNIFNVKREWGADRGVILNKLNKPSFVSCTAQN